MAEMVEEFIPKVESVNTESLPTEIKWWQAWTLAVCYKVVEKQKIDKIKKCSLYLTNFYR